VQEDGEGGDGVLLWLQAQNIHHALTKTAFVNTTQHDCPITTPFTGSAQFLHFTTTSKQEKILTINLRVLLRTGGCHLFHIFNEHEFRMWLFLQLEGVMSVKNS
jgi:hypothetical protein